jgi:hypothetical protein
MGHFTQSTEDNPLSDLWGLNLLSYSDPLAFKKESLSVDLPGSFQTLAFSFNTSESQSMNELSRQYNTNLFNFFYLGLIETLAQLTHKTDVGITTFFHVIDPATQIPKVSPLLIRHKLSSKLSFCEQFNQSSLATLKAYENRHSTLDALLSELNLGSSELFQISLTVTDPLDKNLLYLPCKEVAPIPFPHHPPKANISFSLKYTEEGILGQLRYNESCYQAELMKNLLSNFQKTLKENLHYFDK